MGIDHGRERKERHGNKAERCRGIAHLTWAKIIQVSGGARILPGLFR